MPRPRHRPKKLRPGERLILELAAGARWRLVRIPRGVKARREKTLDAAALKTV